MEPRPITIEKLESKLDQMEIAFTLINNDRNAILGIKQRLLKKQSEYSPETLMYKIFQKILEGNQ